MQQLSRYVLKAMKMNETGVKRDAAGGLQQVRIGLKEEERPLTA